MWLKFKKNLSHTDYQKYMQNILAITHSEDSHLPMVQQHLDEEIQIFDASKFPDDNDISYAFHEGKFLVKSDGRVLSNVSSIWFRKPNYLKKDEIPVDPELQQFTHDAYKTAVTSLYYLMRDKFWLSDYSAITRASNKLLQLEEAKRNDFLVPSTIVTSSELDAQLFREHHQHIVVKSFHTTPVEINGIYKLFYTTRIKPEDEIDFSGLSLAPAIFQEEIRDKKDIRITIVGNKLFPCLITPKPKISDEVDWRYGIQQEDVLYEPYKLPDEIGNKCIQYVKRLGLNFGVIEFALDPDGKYWFLEINPNGQWGFIEEETGMNISSSIADSLRNGGQP